MRWDIINHLIKKVDGKKYLEIGYYKGWSFEAVACTRKIAVDPNPSREPQHEAMVYGSEYTKAEEGVTSTIIKETSDDFFKYQNSHPETYEGPWDVIFIDGLHEAEQVKRDIENSLKHLAPGGYTVLHDMNPPLEEHTKGGIDGCWTGDCYKAMLSYLGMYPFDFHTVDTDWGVGVISNYGTNVIRWEEEKPFVGVYRQAIGDWNCFDQNRKELMNIITPEEFLTKY